MNELDAYYAEREHWDTIRASLDRIDAIRASVPPPPPPGPPTITVPAGAVLQTVLDIAPAGATLALERGATFYGRYIARQPVRLTTAGEWGQARIRPDSPVAWLRSPGNEPALTILSHGVTACSIGIMGNDLPGTALRVGDGELADWDSQPADVHLDGVLLRVLDDRELHRAIAWHGGRGGSIRRCHVEGVKKAGQETQALWISNGHGDLDVEDNFLECASIGILIGGAPQYLSGGIPTGIRIRGNDLPKRREWFGLPYVCKNAIELKCGVDVEIEGNRGSGVVNGENQGGYWLVLTTKDNGHRSPWIRIHNARVRNNVFTDCAAGIKLSAVYTEQQDDGTWQPVPSDGASLITIENNLTVADRQLGVAEGRRQGAAFLTYMQGPVPDLTVIGNTLLGNHPHWWYCEGAPNERGRFGGNVGLHGTYGFSGNGTTGHAVNTWARYFPGGLWTANVLAGGTASRYPPGSVLPSVEALRAGMVDVAAGQFQMRADGPYAGLGYQP